MVICSKNNIYTGFLLLTLSVFSFNASAGFEIKQMAKTSYKPKADIQIQDMFSDMDMGMDEDIIEENLVVEAEPLQFEEAAPIAVFTPEPIIYNTPAPAPTPVITMAEPIIEPVIIQRPAEVIAQPAPVISEPIVTMQDNYLPVANSNPPVAQNSEARSTQYWKGAANAYSGGYKYEERIDYDLGSYIPKVIANKSYDVVKVEPKAEEIIKPLLVNNIWSANIGDSLRSVLEDWANLDGSKLIWSIEYDYKLSSDFESSGSFENAVEEMLDLHKTLSPQPFGELMVDSMNNKSLIIKTY